MKLLFSLFILWLSPFFITSLFNHPALDDYWSANGINLYSRMGAVEYFYHIVSGRYFSLFVMCFCNTLPEGKVWIFKIWPILVIAFLYFSIYFLYGSFISRRFLKADALLLSCLFVVCHISGMRSLFEGLYWMSSTVSYEVAIGLLAIGIGAVIRDLKRPNLKLRALAILASLLLPGTVEIIVPIYVLTLLVILYVFRNYRIEKTTIICSLIILLILGFISVLNKGNLARLNVRSLGYDKPVWFGLWYTVRSVSYYTAVYLVNPLSVFMLLTIGFFILLKNKPSCLITKRTLWALMAYFGISAFAVYFPLHYLESSVPFPRVTTLFFFLFFNVILIIILGNTSVFLKLFNRIFMYCPYQNIRTVIVAGLILSAFTTKNFVLVCRDLFNGTASGYNNEMKDRYRLIVSSNSDTCYIPPHKYWPYFAQSSKDEKLEPHHFKHMDVYFNKTILFR
jgi:hypothetical protein